MAGTETSAEELVQQGLQFYSRGQLDQALNLWNQALAVSPGYQRAVEYIDYVNSNREALEATFRTPNEGALEVDEATPVMDSGNYRRHDTADRFAAVSDASSFEDDEGELPPLIMAADNETLEGPTGTLAWDAPTRAPMREDDTTEPTVSRAFDIPDLAQRDDDTAVGVTNLTGGAMGSGRFPRVTRPVSRRMPSPSIEISPDLIREAAMLYEAADVSALTPDDLEVVDGYGDGAPEAFDPSEPTPIGLDIPEPRMSVHQGVSSAVHVIEEVDLGEDFAPSEPTPASLKRTSDVSEVSRTTLGGAEPYAGARTGSHVAARQEIELAQTQLPELEPINDPSLEISLDLAVLDAGMYAEPDLDPISAAGALVAAEQLDEEQGGFARIDPPTNYSLLDQAEQALSEKNYESALNLCARIAKEAPDDEVAATALAEQTREKLIAVYEEKLGGIERVPVVQVPAHAIAEQGLDHRAGFMLSRIDGMLSFEEVLDICGMPRFDAFRILVQLIDKEIIAPSR